MICYRLFSVADPAELHQRITTGQLSSTVAFINPRMIFSDFHLRLAVHRAIYAFENSKQKTRTIYSELIYRLGPAKNITDCFRSFGVSEQTNLVMLVAIGAEDIAAMDSVVSNLQQSVAAVKELKFNQSELRREFFEQNRDITGIAKAFKLDPCTLVDESAVLNALAVKDLNWTQ